MAQIIKNIYLLPLIILILSIFNEIYVVSTTDIMFGSKHYLGFLLVGISTITAFAKKSLGIYSIGLTLLVGTLNIIAFTPAIEAYSFSFGLNDKLATTFKIQLFSFLILILYLVLNGRFLLKEIRKNKE
jgi:hypothetical protein